MIGMSGAPFTKRTRWSVLAIILAFVVLGLPHRGWSQTQYDTSPGAQTGVQVYGSYFASDIDTIGLYNGNVSLKIDLFSLPGRELSTNLGFSYNSEKWEQKSCTDGSGGTYTCSQYTGGWRMANP